MPIINIRHSVWFVSGCVTVLLLADSMFLVSGTNIKGEMVAPHPTLSTTLEEHMSYYFNIYSKDFLIQVIGFRASTTTQQKTNIENV